MLRGMAALTLENRVVSMLSPATPLDLLAPRLLAVEKVQEIQLGWRRPRVRQLAAVHPGDAGVVAHRSRRSWSTTRAFTGYASWLMKTSTCPCASRAPMLREAPWLNSCDGISRTIGRTGARGGHAAIRRPGVDHDDLDLLGRVLGADGVQAADEIGAAVLDGDYH